MCIHMPSIYHSYILVCPSYVTHTYSYVICMSLVCNFMPFVCRSYLLLFTSYITRMYLHVTRMSLICTSMSHICAFTMNHRGMIFVTILQLDAFRFVNSKFLKVFWLKFFHFFNMKFFIVS